MPEEPVTAYVGLGANLGDREAAIEAALRALHWPPDVMVVRRSSLYETAPVGVTDQPDFLNAVAELRTTLSPRELLARILQLERQLGRVRTQRWGPRVIDIDILLYGDEALAEPGLTVPHPRMAERAFVLRPLAEIAPEAKLPDGETVQKKWQFLAERGNNTSVKPV
ncbi:MAG: 2-amino-4-hydroxy-6-hydroxymethyldihydropteridine diphosphokinase [Armatimonadetes bacterium]|nr:2-amino-4-hydroxy-6-hydroxymethyldihydropteridine diphosphokinase [Armatimonadota bacterium]